MEENLSEEKIDRYKPKMHTLERLDLLDVIPDKTVVLAKLDGEFTLLIYDRDGESYTLNKWGRRRQDFPALNQFVEAMNKTAVTHAKLLCELHAIEDGKPTKLPTFISYIKGQDKDLSKIHIGIWDLLFLERNPVSASFKWKLEEVESWIKGCTHVGIVPYTLPRTLQEVKDFWKTYVEEKGYEGVVIRNGNRTYKIKPTLEVDAVIIGLNKKTIYGKELDLFQQGQVTSIKVALMDEKGNFIELSDCASGITAELRTLLWQLMDYKVNEDERTVYIQPIAVCTIQYQDTFHKRRPILKFTGKEYKWQGWLKFVSLRHPRLIRFRPDKDVNSQDLRLTQISEDKLPKPEEEKSTSVMPSIPVKQSDDEYAKQYENVPRIVKPPIIMNPEDDFSDLIHKLYAEGWRVNSNLKSATQEGAVREQAKVFPCIEFQPVMLPDTKWVAFHRTPIEEYLKDKEREPSESEPEDIGECDICHQTKHIEQLERCETCALIICDNCRPNHKHEAQNPKPTAKFGLEKWF